MSEYRGLIFDMDGLMVDTERQYWDSEYRLADEAGVKLTTKTLHRMMGRKPLEAMTLFCEELNLPGDPADWLEKRDGIMLELMREELIPLPGLEEIIHAFSGVLSLAIATGAHREFMDLVVDTLKVRDAFSVLLSSETVKQGKPHPETYEKACEMLQLKPSQCIVLEDTENGCRAARSAGCHTIAVPSEYTKGQNFSMAHHIVDHLHGAREYITRELRIT